MSARLSLPFTFLCQSGADAVKSGRPIGAVIAVHVQPPRVVWWITAGLGSIAQFGVEWAAGFFAAIFTWIIAFPAAVRAGWRVNSHATWLAIKVFSTATLLIFGAYFLYISVLLIYKTLTSAH